MLSFEALTSRIIGASFRVHNALGAGYLEHIYRNALAHELRKEALTVGVEVPLPVHFGAIWVGNCAADLVVEETVVVELKAREQILPGHLAQLRAYLRASRYPAGLLLNFGPVAVTMKRVEAGRRGVAGKDGKVAG